MALYSLVRRAILLAALAGAAAAQIDLNPQRDPTVIRVDVNLVNLLCAVRDKTGAYVNDLSKDDFAVLDNGRRQTITHFARQADSPLTVAVMLDVSPSVVNILNAERPPQASSSPTCFVPATRRCWWASRSMCWSGRI
jgi:hypothetical protein